MTIQNPDPASDDGRPTVEQVVEAFDYLVSHWAEIQPKTASDQHGTVEALAAQTL